MKDLKRDKNFKKEVVHYEIAVYFNRSKEPTEKVSHTKILAVRGNYCVLDDYSFTTLHVKKQKYGHRDTLNVPNVWKWKHGWDDDGWRCSIYSQMTEKITRRKLFTAFKKEIQKEIFMDEVALEQLKKLFTRK